MTTIIHNRVDTTALAGTLVTTIVHRSKALVNRLVERHRRAVEEDRLWQAALADARQMADISRAMDRAMLRDPRYY